MKESASIDLADAAVAESSGYLEGVGAPDTELIGIQDRAPVSRPVIFKHTLTVLH